MNTYLLCLDGVFQPGINETFTYLERRWTFWGESCQPIKRLLNFFLFFFCQPNPAKVMWEIKYISTCRRCMDTKLGKVLTYIRSSQTWPLIKWQTWGQVTVWKINIFTYVRFTANKLPRLLILGRMFSTQMRKSSPSFCFVTYLSKWRYPTEKLLPKRNC